MMEKPLLVSGPLIQPVRTGSKTETRRLNGLDWVNELPDSWEFVGFKNNTASFEKYEGRLSMHVPCPYGGPGDTIWVRENWYAGAGYDDVKASEIPKLEHVRIGYMADGDKPEWAGRVRPSIHMPKWVCRTFLEVTSVRVERLHAITEKDAEREGVERGFLRDGPNSEKGEFQLELTCKGSPIGVYLDGFKFTWMKLNGRESWELNPWVWVVSFKLKTQ